MKPFLLCIALCFLYSAAYAQQETVIKRKKDTIIVVSSPSPCDSLPTVYPDDIYRILDNRKEALNFFETTLMVSEPTTISFYGLDYTVNTNYAQQKKPFVLNANIQTPIGFGGKKWIIAGNYMHALHVIPQFKVRIFNNDSVKNDVSMPVRTPSYMPRVTYFFTTRKLMETEKTETTASHFFAVSAFHHSNGQDGDEFDADGDINTYSGNFGEQIAFEFRYYGILSRKAGENTKNKNALNKRMFSQNAWIIYWNAAAEWHPRALTEQEFLHSHLYGRYRLNFSGGLMNAPYNTDKIHFDDTNKYYAVTGLERKEQNRVIVNLSYILDGTYNKGTKENLTPIGFFDAGKRMNIDISIYQRLKDTQSSAFFFQAGYYGSDPYNIYFAQSIFIIRAGLSLGNFLYEVDKDSKLQK